MEKVVEPDLWGKHRKGNCFFPVLLAQGEREERGRGEGKGPRFSEAVSGGERPRPSRSPLWRRGPYSIAEERERVLIKRGVKSARTGQEGKGRTCSIAKLGKGNT